MRFRLLRRRLTVSAPRMAIRSTLPWPLRWAIAALVFGFCAAIALWAFEFGKNIAGLDRQSKHDLALLSEEVVRLRAETEKSRSQLNVADTLMAAERAEKDNLKAQLNKMELDTQALRDDLGFFQKLTSANTSTALSIRGLSAERPTSNQMQWQALLMQPVKNAPQFQGQLEVVLTGNQAGKPWSMAATSEPSPVAFKQYLRVEGTIALPPHVVVSSITAKLSQKGGGVKASLTAKVM